MRAVNRSLCQMIRANIDANATAQARPALGV